MKLAHAGRRQLGAALLALAMTVAAGGCRWPGSGGGGEGPTSAEALVGITLPTPSATAPCTSDVQWSLVPMRLTGTSGRESSLTWSGRYTAQPVLDRDYGDQGHSCSFGNTAPERLRAGAWRFQVAAGPYAGACQVTLGNGGNAVSMKVGLPQAKCSG